MMLKIITFFLLLAGSQSYSFAFSNFLNSQTTPNLLSKPLDIKFPLDHGPHDMFTTEWWYITANLVDQNGKILGIQWTLFRNSRGELRVSKEALLEKENLYWHDDQIWMAHAAVTTENDHFFHEKLARGGSGQAGVNGSDFSAWIDDWSFYGDQDWTALKIQAKGRNFEYSLNLDADGPIILHGDNGYSIKTFEGHSSAYYSQPFFKVRGKVVLENDTFSVKGLAWADREWSSAVLGPNQTGWDWFSLHLENNEKLMLFRMRDKNSNHFYSGTLVTRDKQVMALNSTEIKVTPLSHQVRRPLNKSDRSKTPVKWRIEIDKKGFDVITTAINPNSYNDGVIPYWEGPITFSGSHQGVGYLEMTGY